MISEKIVKLNLMSRQICKECDFGIAITQKMRFLFLLRSETRTPRELEQLLSIAKPNLTILAHSMIEENLIEKMQFARDKRAVYYKITQAGIDELNNALESIDVYVQKKVGEKEADKGEKKLDSAISFLSFIE